MKRFVHNVVLFSAMAVLFVAAVVVLIGGTGALRNVKYMPRMWDFSHERLVEASQTKDVDVLFLGSSHCYRTFDTRFYASHGLRTFNLGTSNQTPLQSEMLLQLYLDTLRPRMVVLEVHPDVMCNDGVESSIYLSGCLRPSVPLARMVFSTHNVKAILSALCSTVHNCLPQAEGKSATTTDSNNLYIPGGYVEYVGNQYNPTLEYSIDIKLSNRQINATKRIVGLLTEKGIPYLLVEAPGTEALLHLYRNHDAFAAAMQELGPYVAPRPQLTDSLHFYDEDHLNSAGVALFNAYFYDSILHSYYDKNCLK